MTVRDFDKDDSVCGKIIKLNEWYQSEAERIRSRQADLLEKSEELELEYNKILKNIIRKDSYTNRISK